MIDTKEWRSESLEQVAAHIGYQPWREMCAMEDELKRTKAELAEVKTANEKLLAGIKIANRSAKHRGDKLAKLREAGEALANVADAVSGGVECRLSWAAEDWRAAVGGGEASDGE